MTDKATLELVERYERVANLYDQYAKWVETGGEYFLSKTERMEAGAKARAKAAALRARIKEQGDG